MDYDVKVREAGGWFIVKADVTVLRGRQVIARDTVRGLGNMDALTRGLSRGHAIARRDRDRRAQAMNDIRRTP